MDGIGFLPRFKMYIVGYIKDSNVLILWKKTTRSFGSDEREK